MGEDEEEEAEAEKQVGAQEEMTEGKAPPPFLLREFSFPFSFCQILSPKEIAIT